MLCREKREEEKMKRFLCLLFLCIGFIKNVNAKIEYAATIPVDVEAENSVVAKEQAMKDAQRQAFLEVAGHLISAENVEKLAKLSDDELVHFVKSVGVEDEKSGGNKYMANLTVQINEQLLKDYLAENEMMKSETADILVIPVFKLQDGKYALLWEDDNLWRRAWSAKGLIKFGTMQIKTIYDSLREIDNFGAENALYMESSLYEDLIKAGAPEKIYVVYATELPNGDLKVIIKDEKNKTEDSFTVYGEENSDIYDKAIEKSVMFISNMERAAENEGNESLIKSVNIVYVYQDMKDWLSKNQMIEALPQVEGIETKSFGSGKVNFLIKYTGALEDLWTALQENGLSHEEADNYFILR